MTISIWRYSHLTLAISSALFIVIASLTGIILALEPISEKLNYYNSEDLNMISIAETVTVLEEKYKEIITIEIDENDFVKASIITKERKSETFYINPKTGIKVGDLTQKSPLFKFATNLHRSLFLKSTGRFLIGFVSLLLFLISITGVLLITKRQGGFSKIFSKVIKEDFNQYYHVVFGRYFLIPIIIITLTGIYLSLEKFSLLPKEHQKHINLETNKITSNLKTADFEFFKITKLEDIQKIEFPFSKEKEDYFYVKTRDKEFAIHQFNGQIISKKKQDLIALGSYYSMILHTGKGSIIWSLVLLLTCFSIIFFMYSGFSMTLKRKKKTTTILNKTTKDEVEFIILVGSETGTTIRFATAFKNALLKAGKTVFISELNNYSIYEKAKSIIIFTATYGDGEAPANASKFIKLIDTIQQKNILKYAVLGFGSKEYIEFCKFAVLVHASLQIQQKFIPIAPLFRIDNQEINSFKNWLQEWNNNNNLSLKINDNELLENKQKEIKLKILEKSNSNLDDTFLISLQPSKKVKFTSGDVLSITPKNENRSRLYSIAKVDKNILLSVKKHELGICSNYLNQLNKNDFINGTIKQNINFHFPKKAKEVLLIANGTGIAPFLGMIHENKRNIKTHLFWGTRTKESLKIYQKYLEKSANKNELSSLNIAFSKENKKKIYVQYLLFKKKDILINTLKSNGKILICGSLAMQKEVEKIIDEIAKKELNVSVEKLKENKQLKTDCY
ncbi:MAG: PepSY domain-containing protein [Polaribacter sp.]|uniref:PepSY domain-containing protein n=1 Tax=Polaribacter sp. TaxID=1920175 RepID=UPI002F359F7E